MLPLSWWTPALTLADSWWRRDRSYNQIKTIVGWKRRNAERARKVVGYLGEEVPCEDGQVAGLPGGWWRRRRWRWRLGWVAAGSQEGAGDGRRFRLAARQICESEMNRWAAYSESFAVSISFPCASCKKARQRLCRVFSDHLPCSVCAVCFSTFAVYCTRQSSDNQEKLIITLDS